MSEIDAASAPRVAVLPIVRVRATGVLALVLGAVLVAAVTVAITPTMRADPEGWLRWARAVGLGDGAFSTSAYPSWKPLGLLLALPFAATGPAASVLWLVAMRAAGVLVLVLVWRFAARRAGAAAGWAAVALLALAPAWWTATLGGAIEPAIVLLGCGAVLAHEQRRHGLVLALLSLMALGRQEALVLVLGYGLLLGAADPRLRAAAGGLAALVLAAWLGGDWLGSGDPFHGGDLARAAPAEHPFSRFSGAHTAVAAVVVPAVLVLLARGVRAARAGGDRVLLALAAAAAAWIAADLALLAIGLPLPPRFLLPAAAALAVVAGTGTRGLRLRRPTAPLSARA